MSSAGLLQKVIFVVILRHNYKYFDNPLIMSPPLKLWQALQLSQQKNAVEVMEFNLQGSDRKDNIFSVSFLLFPSIPPFYILTLEPCVTHEVPKIKYQVIDYKDVP